MPGPGPELWGLDLENAPPGGERMRLPRPRMGVLLVLTTAAATGALGAVELAGDRCILVDGKPFFAVGIYNAFDQTGQEVGPDFTTLARAGFNLVHSYAWEGEADYKGEPWLDAAQAAGLKALVGIYRPDLVEMKFERTVERIKRYRDHPALLAWHVMDEPHWDRVDAECLGIPVKAHPGREYMPAAYRLLKEHDPAHPVTTVTVNHDQIRQFIGSVDIMQTDYYCIPPLPATSYFGTGFLGVRRWVLASREASGGNKPFWFVCQAWDYGKDKVREIDVPEEWQRFPTQMELQTMTYTAIASGARGVLYYALHLVMDESKTRGGDRQEYLHRLFSVTRQLQVLQPVLTASTAESIQDANHVVAMVKSDGTDLYVIVANYERAATEVALDIPGVREGTAEQLFVPGTVAVTEGQLKCALGPIESRIYRIR
jgi:hypothetical protein